MKLDCYTHIFPLEFFKRMEEVVPDKRPIKRWLNIPVLYDVDARLRMMEQFGEYQQILTLSAPPIEYMAGPEVTPGLARLANDGMAALCKKYPDRFPAFIASLPLNNMPEALKEIDRSIKELDARGIQIFSNINGKPLDAPEFYPMFEKMAQYDLPIWLHPTRGQTFPDYKTEQKSFYEIWFVFGWPYETSAAMARIVFSGIFDKLPNIKIITHHLGAMAPYFEGRVGTSWDQIGTRDADDTFEEMRERMRSKGRRPIDYFKMFYADTAVFGARAATVCGLDFFGTDRVVFASDCPFDPEGGPMYIRETIKVLDSIKMAKSKKDALYLKNTKKLLKLK